MSKKLYESDIDKLYNEVFGSDFSKSEHNNKRDIQYQNNNVSNNDLKHNSNYNYGNKSIRIILGLIFGIILYILF